MIFVRPPGGRLPKLGEVWEKDANAKQTSNSGALLHTQFAALYGLPIDAALTRFKLHRIKVVAAGAKDFRMVKSGPVGVYSCKGCLIFEFDEDLKKGGPDFLSELQEGGGKRLDIDGQAVIKSSEVMYDERKHDVFTAHPAGRVMAFTNDLDLMKQCLRRVKENPQLKASRPESPPWFAKHVDPKASFTAIRVEGDEKGENYKFVVNWNSDSPGAVEIIWLSNHIPLPAGYAEEIRKQWKMPPRDLMPALVKVEKGNVWLEFKFKDKDEWAYGVLLILFQLGFTSTF